jgi:hypothetical protein
VFNYPDDSPLADAVPGDAVTVRLKIFNVKRAVTQRVQMTEPLPPVYDEDGTENDGFAEYTRALECGGPRTRRG